MLLRLRGGGGGAERHREVLSLPGRGHRHCAPVDDVGVQWVGLSLPLPWEVGRARVNVDSIL